MDTPAPAFGLRAAPESGHGACVCPGVVRIGALLLVLAAAAFAGERACPACERALAPVGARHVCRFCSGVLHTDARGRETFSLRIDGERRTFEMLDGVPVALPAPGHPVKRPDHAVERPHHPVERPAHPVERPAHPVERPQHPVARPAHPVERPEHPVQRASHTLTRPAHAVERPLHAFTRPEHPVARPGHAVSRPGHPVATPVAASADATDTGSYGAPIARSGPPVRAAPAVRVFTPRTYAPPARPTG